MYILKEINSDIQVHFLLYLPDKLRKNIYIELFESYIAYDARARGEKETHE